MNGLHLDIKWSMYRPQYFEKILARARELGIDTILLEFENKVFIDWLQPALHPEHWSVADLKRFLQLAKKYHLTIIPSVPLLGHMEWILQWPQWAYLRENYDFHEICASHPGTPEFVRRLLADTLRLFADSPIIHLGGDETWSLGSCPVCKNSGKTKGELYLNHYLPLIRQVEAAGKRAMIYGDMILAHPEVLDRLPRSVIICDWDYWSGREDYRHFWGVKAIKKTDSWSKFPKPMQKFKKYFFDRQGNFVDFPYLPFLKEAGFDVVALSAARSSGDNFCAARTKTHVLNAMAGARRARELNLTGTLVTSWQVRFNHLETNWPAIAASAWTYQNPELTYDQLSSRFAREFFGCDWPTAFADLDLLSPDLPGLKNGAFPPDIIPPYFRFLYMDPKSDICKYTLEHLPAFKKSFQRGLAILTKQKSKITRNRDAFDHWLLAAETLVHKAHAEPAMMKLSQGKKIPAALKTKLQREIRRLADRHKKLFGQTMPPVSTAMEINLRFREPMEMLTGRTIESL